MQNLKYLTSYSLILLSANLFGQSYPDMTILLDYFDETVEIYVDQNGYEIVINADGVPHHQSPYFVSTWAESNNGFYYFIDENGDGINDMWTEADSDMNLNPNRIAEQELEFRVPLYPFFNSSGPSDTHLGPCGASLNGVPLYDRYEGPNQELNPNTIQTFDQGNGHPAPQGRYHYHFPPAFLMDVEETNFVGFAADGFPVYSPKNPDGTNADNLDECHGEFGPTPDFPDGIYHYHTSYVSPYIFGCFKGEEGIGFGGQGGGGGGIDPPIPPSCSDVYPGMPCCGDTSCSYPETIDNCPEDCELTEMIVDIEFSSDWNLVGLPLEVDNSEIDFLFPESIEGTLYSFADGYNLETNLIYGEGYWLRFSNIGITTINGFQINELSVSLNEGWNLISGITNSLNILSIQDPDGIIIPSTVYGFTSDGYSNIEIIHPGKGYWIRTNSSGEILLSNE